MPSLLLFFGKCAHIEGPEGWNDGNSASSITSGVVINFNPLTNLSSGNTE